MSLTRRYQESCSTCRRHRPRQPMEDGLPTLTPRSQQMMMILMTLWIQLLQLMQLQQKHHRRTKVPRLSSLLQVMIKPSHHHPQICSRWRNESKNRSVHHHKLKAHHPICLQTRASSQPGLDQIFRTRSSRLTRSEIRGRTLTIPHSSQNQKPL